MGIGEVHGSVRFRSEWIMHRGLGPQTVYTQMKGRAGVNGRLETFQKLLFTYSYELFDPSKDLLAKSKKLGLRASDSLGFAHRSGHVRFAQMGTPKSS
jgi:hypothetical protein